MPEAARGVNGVPQMEVYSVTTADPEMVVKMLQTLLHNDPNVVLSADKEGSHVFAFATPPLQATIRATIDQMQKDSRAVDVIIFRMSIRRSRSWRSINSSAATDDKPDPKGPRVDADLTTRSLLVRGTAGQVAQIRELLRKLGETEEEGGGSCKIAVSTCDSCRSRAPLPARQFRRSNRFGQTCEQTAFAWSRQRRPSPVIGPVIRRITGRRSRPRRRRQRLAKGPTINSSNCGKRFLQDRQAPAKAATQSRPDGAKLKSEKDRAARSDTRASTGMSPRVNAVGRAPAG